MKSVMTHQFSQVPSANIQRSAFNRSHGYKTTFDAGYLIPVLVDEALPGDTFNVQMTSFARLSTPIKPIMDNLWLDSFFFAVPIRLVWDNFKKFMGEQENPEDSTDYLVPTMTSPTPTGHIVGSLSDYMGIPIGKPNLEHSSLWHRAYNLIWNEFFRDQNLQDSVVVDKDDGPDTHSDYEILKRGKRHDYFTSCLPWPQKGDAIDLPLGTEAPVISNGLAIGLNNGTTDGTMRVNIGTGNIELSGAFPGSTSLKFGTKTDESFTGLITDLSSATAATVNALREAFQMQKMLEKDARGGTRYIELIKSHFNVTSPDARQQRPEYLGGGTTPVNINPVAQTAASGAAGTSTKQGNLAAFGTASGTHGFTKSFTEHTLIIGMVNVRADLTYQQGLNKMFKRQTKYDFYWPSLANLGEQEVYLDEIYAQGTADDEEVFGYQERYAEYRYKPSQITGKFRSTASGTLDIWHLSQQFGTAPTLGKTFIEETPPMSRILAVPSEPHFIFDSYFNMNCVRPMPVYSIPGLIDHF